MTITLSLQSPDEARLIAAADARGISPDQLVREALDSALHNCPSRQEAPSVESRPIWEVLLDNMKDAPEEEFAGVPRGRRE